MPDKLIAFMYQAWDDLDQAVRGLTPEEATTRHDGGSSIAWTVGHVTYMVDSWFVVKFQGLPPHPVISDPIFRAGASGEAKDYPGILVGVNDVRRSARRLLDGEPDLDRVIPYHGSIEQLRPTGLSLRYAIMRIAAHHFLHVGEILTIRSRLGHAIPDVPDWGAELL